MHLQVTKQANPNLPVLIHHGPRVMLILAALILACDPAIWLVNTWRDPAYESAGFVIFAITVALFLWSVSSRLTLPGRQDRNTFAIGLIVFSAVIRFVSQTLAINTIGAICLIVDVYALGTLLCLDQRSRAISPFWLAVTFAFSLPLERIVQRGIGYPLQQVSADGACALLSSFYSDLVCHGTRLIVRGVDVMVDLPCSGAGTVLLGLLGFALASTICRPSLGQAVVGCVVMVLTAAASNVLRISILAVGLAQPEMIGGRNVMEQPWHDMIGLAAFTVVCGGNVMWAYWVLQRPSLGAARRGHALFLQPLTGSKSSHFTKRLPHVLPQNGTTKRWSVFIAGLVALASTVVIVNLPRTAIDVSKRVVPPEIPLSLNGRAGKLIQLDKREELFFTQFGGWAQKARYGEQSLMLVHTTSPLRHLHAPEDCLRGLGFEVQYLGVDFSEVPTAIYRATAPDGRRYWIDVSFISDQNDITTNVARAVWSWLHGTARNWTAVQRISPEHISDAQRDQFNRAVFAALDIVSPTQIQIVDGGKSQ